MSAELASETRTPLQLLAERIAAGDASAENEFVRHFRAGVMALVRRHARPFDADIEDMTQDVLQSTITALRDGRVRDHATLPAYLRTSVTFTVRSHYRKRHRRHEDCVVELDDGIAVNDDPADNVTSRQLALLVRQLVGQLQIDRDRKLLERFYLREQSKVQVCTELGISDEHFHRVAFRARERLRILLLDAGVFDDNCDN
ncbi:MAG: sigma-70 family RNA polymerase sigma factor [Dokdonella sp.]